MQSNETTVERSRWLASLRRTALLLLVWLLVGPIGGILLVDRLNAWHLNGLPLGFWISVQGAILVFVLLIFLYAWLSDRAEGAER